MRVIKLGGSLTQANTLLKCLDKIDTNYTSQKIVIVPGGGAFADQVRTAQSHWLFDDSTAHKMAILAMQQMAILIQGLKSHWSLAESTTSITEQFKTHNVLIWSPSIHELETNDIPESWDITSDSLAAWLANKLSAKQLTLVKSASIDQNLSLQELSLVGVIDKSFCEFVAESEFKIDVVNQADFKVNFR
ncbi:MAG: uridylate kinase [Methylococcales bacterium]|nr:uridylate kinase [Methylococcales bacterium]